MPVDATPVEIAGLKDREADHNPRSTGGPDEETAWMQAFRDGDDEAFVKLYRRYRDRMVNFTRRFLGDPARAEEAAQDVFLKLYTARDRYEVRSRFSTFLYRIAANHCVNMLARHEHKLTRPTAIAEDLATVAADQDDAVRVAQLRTALTAALGKLPDNQRAALLLCHYEGMSYAQAAEVIDTSVGAVKSLVHRARDGMMRELAPYVAAEVGDAV